MQNKYITFGILRPDLIMLDHAGVSLNIHSFIMLENILSFYTMIVCGWERLEVKHSVVSNLRSFAICESSRCYTLEGEGRKEGNILFNILFTVIWCRTW